MPLHTRLGALGMLCLFGICCSLADGSVLAASWFDPAVASLGFAVSIAFYDWREQCEGLTHSRGAPLGPAFRALVAYWAGVSMWRRVVPPPPAIPDGLPTTLSASWSLLAEVAYGVWAYDFVFFFVHWAMHALPSLRRIHHDHHAAGAQCTTAKHDGLRAKDVLTHSLLDGTLQVLVNIAVQRRTPWGVKSRLARALHNVIVTWMLTESHTAALHPRVARRVPFCAGVRRHRLHHTENAPHLQQLFGYLDDGRAAAARARPKWAQY